MAVGGNEWRRKQFAPLLIDVPRVAPCYEYRDRAPDETQDHYTGRLLAEFEAKILEVGAERVIGFCAETVEPERTPRYYRHRPVLAYDATQ